MIKGFEEYTEALSNEEWARVHVIVKMLREAEGRWVTAKELAAAVGWAGTQGQARVRKVIHIVRVAGEIEKLIANGGGYKIATSDEEVCKYLSTLESRISSMQSVRSALLRQISGQRELPFGR